MKSYIADTSNPSSNAISIIVPRLSNACGFTTRQVQFVNSAVEGLSLPKYCERSFCKNSRLEINTSYKFILWRLSSACDFITSIPTQKSTIKSISPPKCNASYSSSFCIKILVIRKPEN